MNRKPNYAGLIVVALIVLLMLRGVGGVIGGSPCPGDGFHLAIIEDRATRSDLTAGQMDAMFSVQIDDLMKPVNGKRYLMDAKSDQSSESDEWARKAFALPRKPLPMYVIDHNGRGEVGTVTTLAEFKKTVGKYLK